MGLLEKRALKEFQDKSYPKTVAEINALAGYKIAFDVKWDTIALEEKADLYDECFTKVYFTPLINALKEITADKMGKEALKKELKKVVIKNEIETYYGDTAYSYEKGVLTIDHLPFSNVDNIDERSKALSNLLMKQL